MNKLSGSLIGDIDTIGDVDASGMIDTLGVIDHGPAAGSAWSLNNFGTTDTLGWFDNITRHSSKTEGLDKLEVKKEVKKKKVDKASLKKTIEDVSNKKVRNIINVEASVTSKTVTRKTEKTDGANWSKSIGKIVTVIEVDQIGDVDTIGNVDTIGDVGDLGNVGTIGAIDENMSNVGSIGFVDTIGNVDDLEDVATIGDIEPIGQIDTCLGDVYDDEIGDIEDIGQVETIGNVETLGWVQHFGRACLAFFISSRKSTMNKRKSVVSNMVEYTSLIYCFLNIPSII